MADAWAYLLRDLWVYLESLQADIFFLPPLLVGLYELREAFREPKSEVNKL
jgi:hypothetical protein